MLTKKINNKVILLIIMIVIGFSLLFIVNSVSATSWSSSNAEPSSDHFYIHVANWGSAFKPNHWTAPNGVSFTDKAWLLAYVAGYEIVFFDKNHTIIDQLSGTLTSGSGVYDITIPAGTVAMQITAKNGLGDNLMFAVPAEGGGAMNFDGTTRSRNFHLKMVNGWDSGYLKLYQGSDEINGETMLDIIKEFPSEAAEFMMD
ncbi:MAG: hypothetical protein LBM26_05365 [Methanobrevibacter sp.]|jgi:hypothetical protein|nr:hypothetical protein [Methanobrevibacter sp.]